MCVWDGGGVGGGTHTCLLQMPNFALDYAVVKTQKLFSLHGGFLTYAINHNRETI